MVFAGRKVGTQVAAAGPPSTQNQLTAGLAAFLVRRHKVLLELMSLLLDAPLRFARRCAACLAGAVLAYYFRPGQGEQSCQEA
jgi:hypothetical protein